MAWKSFSKVLLEYLEFLETNDVYTPKGNEVSFPLRVVSYLTFLPEGEKDERELVLKTLEILLDSGVDFTIKDPLKKLSPIDFLRRMDENQMADYILNRSLNSATEAVAFEKIDKQKLKNALGKVGNFIKNVATKPTEWLVKGAGKAGGVMASTAAGGKDNLKRYRQEAKEKKEGPKNPEVNMDDYKSPSTDSPEELNKRVKEYKTSSEKEVFIRNVLDEKLGSESRTLFAKALVKETEPFTSTLYKLTKKFVSSSPDQPIYPICPEATKIILSNRYSEIRNIFMVNLDGLLPLNNPDGVGMKQLKIIAFYCMRGYNTDNLRKDGKWMSVKNMEKVVNGINVLSGQARYGSATPEEIAKWLKKVIGDAFKAEEISEKEALDFIKNFGIEFPKNARLTSVFIAKAPKYSGSIFQNLTAELKRYEKENRG